MCDRCVTGSGAGALTQKAALTVVLPAPRGPTSSTELLSPWTAVRLSRSSRCLGHRDYITHNAPAEAAAPPPSLS